MYGPSYRVMYVLARLVAAAHPSATVGAKLGGQPFI